MLRLLTLESAPKGIGHDELMEGRRDLDGRGVRVFAVRAAEQIHAMVMTD